jgi:hypothetical protein
MIIVCVTTLNCHEFLINGNIVKRSIRRPVRLTVALKAVPWLRSLVAGLLPRVPGFAPASVWDLWWTKWHWDRFFSEFPCQYIIPPSLSKLIFWGMRKCANVSRHPRLGARPTPSSGKKPLLFSFTFAQDRVCII